jgi:hypothetical protein
MSDDPCEAERKLAGFGAAHKAESAPSRLRRRVAFA